MIKKYIVGKHGENAATNLQKQARKQAHEQ